MQISLEFNGIMESIKVLIIGKHKWVENLSEYLNKMDDSFSIEKIEDEDAAIRRLTHNSYNILLIQDKFSKLNPIKLASLAYAMTRPSLIVCSNIFNYVKFLAWHYLSSFSWKFKTSKKLINFNYKFEDLKSKIESLSKDYMNYFNIVNDEIKKNTL